MAFSVGYFRPQLALLAPRTPTFTVTATMTPTATDTPTSTTTSTSAATQTAIPIPPKPVTIDYAYDPLHRLTSANYSTGDYYHYTYDSVGNRLTEESKVKGLLSAVDYVYDEANRLTSVDNVAYTWDANGNLLNDGVNIYTYDSANRLTVVRGPSSVVSYSYNGLGDRLTQNNVHYTLDLNSGLTQVLDDGENTYLYGNGRIAQTGGATEYFLGDALGSVRQLTNEEAEITLTKAYEPYGEEAWSYGEGQSAYGFAAEWTDSNGLIHLRARYYAPWDGRFISRDTFEGNTNDPASLNRFNYAHSNPVMNTDPSGHCLFTGVDTIACALLTAGVTGFLVGADIGGAFGLITYGWALAGECGCEMREAAMQAGNRGWFALSLALGGGIIGGVAGVAAVLAPAAMIFIGGAGAYLSYRDALHVVNQIERLETGGRTWCTAMRLILDVVGMAFGAYAMFKGVQAWAASGKILKWANGISPYPTTIMKTSSFSELTAGIPKGKPVVVIGETMTRVNPIANQLRAAGFNVQTYNPKSVPPTLEANRAWLRYWTLGKGATVVDIGLDKTRTIPSEYYALVQQLD